MAFLDRFFPKSYEKTLKAARARVPEINAQADAMSALSDDALKAKTDEFKERLNTGETLNDILPEAFAVVREAATRSVGLRHYDVQLIGGIVLHEGQITEMRTGEGKTLVGTLPGYLNALTGEGVHVITVNDYLARRDAVWMGQVYHALGLSVGIVNHNTSYLYNEAQTADEATDEERDETGSYQIAYDYLTPCSRKEAYAADITYGTNNEFGFDYLRDNIALTKEDLVQRGHAYAIVDEIDSVLIDEARTPLIISAPAEESENLYTTFAGIAAKLKPEDHYVVDEKLKTATLTDAGIERAESLLGIENIYTEKGMKYVHHLETAVRAQAVFTRDKEYVVRDGEVVIVDEFTGRLQPGRRWSEGLHQAIEAKEGVAIKRESRTFASVTYQNYFRLYTKLSGMTGTALTSEEEFYTVYGLDVVPVPTHQQTQRIDHNDLIFQRESGKFTAIARAVKERTATGQPILIGSASIEKNEAISKVLTATGVTHSILNAKNHESEGEIIADAGRKGAVTLATNMAGRGVDIKLGGANATDEEADEVRALGGLFVLGTERHEARRIDNQLRGRAGRQGDPGATQFFVSMEDSLMRVFGGDRIKSLMGTFKIPEDQPIENKMITKQLESAQTRIEGFHFDARKQVLAYDDVLNTQRHVVYERRMKLLCGDAEAIDEVLSDVIVFDPELDAVVKEKSKEFTDEEWHELLRRVMLQTIDTLWVEHLEATSYARSSVNLRAYGQRDPLIEYRKEAKRLFNEMQESVLYRISKILSDLDPVAVQEAERERKETHEKIQRSGGTSAASTQTGNAQQRVNADKIGRNELVTITNGAETKELKFKKAEQLLASGEWKIAAK